VIVCIVLWGLAMVGFGVVVGLASPGDSPVLLWIALAFLAFGGAVDMVFAAFRGTMLQQVATDEMRGRLQGVFIVVVAGGPRIGDVVHGAAAAAVGGFASGRVGASRPVPGLRHTRHDFGLRPAARAQAERDIVRDPGGKHHRMLVYITDRVAQQARIGRIRRQAHRLPQEFGASDFGAFQAGENAQQRALARAVGAGQHIRARLPDHQRVDIEQQARAERFAQPMDVP